jgi:apolipoprotein N-acyltransferase
VDQRTRNEAATAQGAEARKRMASHFVTLCDQAAETRPLPNLIIWPETSFPGAWVEDSPGRPDEVSQKMIREVAERWPTPVLAGISSYIHGTEVREVRYNSALLICPEGKNGQVVGRYDKVHRVPFGEYVPLQDWFPWMNYFAPYDFDYSVRAGESQTRFPLGPYHFGVLICYEDTDPWLARQYVRRNGEPQADFLVNISNDGWFNGTSEHEEHLAICRFRAIESRRAVVRAVNMGVSAVIDGNGRVRQPTWRQPRDPEESPIWEVHQGTDQAELPLAQWGQFKKIAGVLVADVPIDRRISFYALWGDWLPQACWLLIAAGFVWPYVRSWRPARG